MAKTYKYVASRFFCTHCGREGMPIQRKKGQLREPGHLKKLYCIYCKEETNHAEIRDIGGYNIEDFQDEFKCGRFIDGNRIEIEQCYGCTKESCPFNKNGKCWNANNSEHCRHKPEKEESVWQT